MPSKSIIIIGAGLSGLSAGVYAQLNGYSSQIFEHASKPGGVAACWKRKGYTFDGGIHFVMSYKPGSSMHELYRELGILESNSFIEMKAYGRFIDEESGKVIDITQDLDKFARDLKKISPGYEDVIDRLIKGVKSFQGRDLGTMGMEEPPELAGFFSPLKQMWQIRGLMKYFSGENNKAILEFTKDIDDRFLRNVIEYLFLPEVPLWFIYMVLAIVADGEMGYIEGGSLNFARAIENRYKKLGGEVRYNSTVTGIIVENDTAVGVRLADGSEHRADYVVSTADGYSVIFGMLNGKYVDDKIKDRYENWELLRPLLIINYGVAREFPDEIPFITIAIKEPFKIGKQVIDGLMVRFFNFSDKFAPKGKSVVQVELETEWEYWNDLQGNNRNKYEAEKERVANELLKRLEKYYPGISKQVEVTDVATPYTYWRYTLNREGAWGAWLPTADTMMESSKRTLPGLSNFYMAGQWAMMNGVPPALFSGKHAVQLICRKDKKSFKSVST